MCPEYDQSLDNVQRHILGVIVGLMTSFNISPDHATMCFKYMSSLPPHLINNSYEPHQDFIPSGSSPSKSSTEEPDSSGKSSSQSWADMCDEDEDEQRCCIQSEYKSSPIQNDADTSDSDDSTGLHPLYVSTRRQFCAAMQNKIRICPRYSTCEDGQCENFHIKPEFVCPHVVRGSYCDNKNCELIVIRACRKGKSCNNPECSFRHV